MYDSDIVVKPKAHIVLMHLPRESDLDIVV